MKLFVLKLTACSFIANFFILICLRSLLRTSSESLFTSPFQRWHEYLYLSGVVTLIQICILPIIFIIADELRLGGVQYFLQIFVTFVVLVIASLILSTSTSAISWLTSKIGSFFSEWAFINFIIFAAPLFAVFSAVQYVFFQRKWQAVLDQKTVSEI